MGEGEPLPRDAGLLERFKRGEREAMADVFDYYSEPIARYLRDGFVIRGGAGARRFVGLREPAALQDAVAETFRRAFEPKARRRLSPDTSSYLAYLRTIARNLVIDQLRKRDALWEAYDEGLATPERAASGRPAPRPITSPDLRAERAELAGLMGAFLETLEPAEERLLRLRFVERLSQARAAKRLNKSRRYVRELETLLRERLLRHLRDTGYLPDGAEGG